MSILINSLGHGQGERDYWYFGQKAGMKFTDTGLVSLDDNTIGRNIVFGFIEGPDNIICASDENGKLLFYSDGRIFRNRLHQNLLNSPTDKYALRYSQASIARYPGNSHKYFVFVTIQEGLKTRLTYSIVDMTLDNGLGGLVPNKKHVVLLNDVGQPMTIARHANGTDRWLICIKKGTYYVYLITSNGISSSPITSSAGVFFFDGDAADIGSMQMSPNNQLIGVAFPLLRKLFLLEFNNLTGRIDLLYEDEELDQSPFLGPFTSVEFSPNGKVLYTSYLGAGIKQYDISDLENIPPRLEIASGNNYAHLKRGPDGKIYSIQPGSPYIGAINAPNILGLDCDYSDNVLTLSTTNLLDLPTFLLPKVPEGLSYINICLGEETEFNYAASYRDDLKIIWDFGDGNNGEGSNISHSYENPGSYSVTVNAVNDNNEIVFTDSKIINIYDTPLVNKPQDLFFCAEDISILLFDLNIDILDGLNPDVFDVKYYPSENDALLKNNEIIEYVPEIGTKTIWVRIENRLSPSCFSIVDFDINTPQFITIDMPTEQFICDLKSGLTITAPDGFSSYYWSLGDSTQSITVFFPGIYTLTVEQDFGNYTCSTQIKIKVLTGNELPTIENIQVIDWSQNHNSIEVEIDRIGQYEYSVDGINYQESPIFLNLPIDDYYVYVRDKRCLQEIKSEKLYLLYHDKFFTPNGDGVNDYWRVINNFREEDIEIQIFDRFGKLLETMSYYDRGWDGSFNGIPMPTSDYWFRVVRQNGKTHYGHFTLKR